MNKINIIMLFALMISACTIKEELKVIDSGQPDSGQPDSGQPDASANKQCPEVPKADCREMVIPYKLDSGIFTCPSQRHVLSVRMKDGYIVCICDENHYVHHNWYNTDN